MNDYNADTSGTFPGGPFPPKPSKTMAEAIREFPTAVRVENGLLVSIHGETSPETDRLDNVAKSAGKIVCGDCGSVFPCPHGDGTKTRGY